MWKLLKYAIDTVHTLLFQSSLHPETFNVTFIGLFMTNFTNTLG